jgi:hypothetical protein
MYIPTGGYGGYLNNTNWLERCDEIDYRAWDQTRLLKNQFNEYIYQCDYKGNKLFLKHGLFFLHNYEKAEVTYNNLAYEGLNTFTVSNDLTSPMFKYNIYRIKPSVPEIYSPKSQIWFNHKYTGSNSKPNNLALIKIIKAGIEITDFTDYTFEFLDYENNPLILTDQNHNVIVPANGYLEFNSGFIRYYWNTSNEELPLIEGDILKFKVIDNFGQVAIKEFEIQRSDEKEHLRINSISEIYTFEDYFIKNDFANIIFDRYSIIDTEEILKSEDLTISPNEINIRNDVTQDPNVHLTLKNMVQSNRIFYQSNMYTFDLDIRALELSFYAKKNWTTYSSIIDIKNDLKTKIYSGDNDITESTIFSSLFTYSLLNNNIIVNIDNKISLSQPYTTVSNPIDLPFTTYIIKKNTPTVDIVYSSGTILVDGLYGVVLLKVPNYTSFQDLLDKLEYIIEYRDRRIITTIDPFTKTEFNNFVEIAKNNSYIVLDQLINYDKFVDGGNNYLKIKILPVQSIYSSLKTANNEEYIYEVTQKETEMYGLDRIWINEKSYPLPPILINKVLYNSENIPYYYENTWMNKDNYTIYSCNEEGKYVKFVPAGKTLITKVIGDSRGDTRTDIFGSIDPRHNPLEPVYKSSLDWFLSEYYIKGKESNPFMIELNLTEEIKNKKFNQVINITQKVKLDNDFINKKISDSYVSKIINNIRYEPQYSETGGILIQENSIDFIDYTNGIINFSIVEPNITYRDNQRLFLFGINYYNQYYLRDDNALLRGAWFNIAHIDNKIDMSFDINSFENYLDKKNKDYAVRWFTEMGIFDQFGHLIAYCTHPKVEYRTDSQHISYSLIIEEEN